MCTPLNRVMASLSSPPRREVFAMMGVLLLGRCWPHALHGKFSAVGRRLRHLAGRSGLSMAMIGALTLAGGIVLSWDRLPEPSVHDEYSYLLAADTFAHRRLSNPTHPLWVHFESFHIIQQPTYASKYPPVQGMVLAAGQVLGGHPVTGLWIGSSLGAMAIYWMLRAWMPPAWAFLGGVLTALHPGILQMWGQTYWGGTMALLGGALVFGGVRRLVRRPRVRDALLLTIGLAVLANGRPYEGFIVSVPVALALLGRMLSRKGPPLRVSIVRVGLPVVSLSAVIGAWMGFYNWRVTGEVWRMPYQLYEATYASAPLFLWQQPPSLPLYRHEPMRHFYVYNVYRFMEQQTLRGLARTMWQKVQSYWGFVHGGSPVQWGFLLPIVTAPWLLRGRWTRFALLTCGILGIGLVLELWDQPHYAAPATGLIVFLILQSMRYFRLWCWRGARIGSYLVWVLVGLTMLSFFVAFATRLRSDATGWPYERARLLKQLSADEARHLVIVRYGPQHGPNQEWVYNEADIDTAKVVWAREMEPHQTQQLLEYFHDRQVWLAEVNVDHQPPRVLPYPLGNRP